MVISCPEQSCFVLMHPLTPRCSFKLVMQEQTHSMRLRSSVIKTPLLGGDGDLMAEVIAEASAERAIQSGCVRLRECACVLGAPVVSWLYAPFVDLWNLNLRVYLKSFHFKSPYYISCHRSFFQELIVSRKSLVHYLMILYQVMGIVKV